MTKQIYDLEERLLEYSVRIIKIVDGFQIPERAKSVLAGGTRSGTLIQTMVIPGGGIQRDFIHKIRISLKELRETQMTKASQRVPLISKPELLDDIINETEELIKIFVTSIKTAEKRRK